MIIIKLDCDFIITPRILFNDKNLSRTDIDILSLIISLTFKYGYCYACNDKLAKYVNISIRTLSDSLSKLRKLNYIIVKSEYKNRRIYINQEKIPMKSANDVATKCDDIAENCSQEVATFCYLTTTIFCYILTFFCYIISRFYWYLFFIKIYSASFIIVIYYYII